MKKILTNCIVVISMILSYYNCAAQPEWIVSNQSFYPYTPINLEDESGVESKIKFNIGYAYSGSAGVYLSYLPFEVYVDLSAGFYWNKTRFPCTDKFKHNILMQMNPGGGIRFYLKDKRVSPLLSAGINYDLIFYKGFYGTKKDQVNSGVNNTFGIGCIGDDPDNYYEKVGWVIELVLPTEKYFYNKDFSPDGGYSYPYANLKQYRRWGINFKYLFVF